jgi:tetraacyldisaccharide 4'-kinase
MRDALQRAWRRRGALARLLWPLSLLFGALARLHRGLYRTGLLRSERLSVPVVVVGNVVAGGAGKTPVVMALLEHLRGRGIHAGVVSRGYGRQSSACLEVTAGSRPDLVGDEPLLIQRASGVPVFVARRRAEAGRALLAAHPAVQVIVSDDGLQHHALQRDLELCLFDERGIGNGWLLPAGPLREAWPRPVDFVLSSEDAPSGPRGFPVKRELATWAQNGHGQRIDLSRLRGQPLVALAGIARPEAFFAMLRSQGLQLAETLALPDHYDFDSNVRPASAGYTLICTEKDAVKLWRNQPDAWAVPLQLQIEAGFWPAFDRLLDSKLSSRHGPQTS